MMSEVFCNVYKETDYSKFKYLIGNRNLTETRKKRIMNSIQKVGYVMNPIIVNEKMEIIDGQGRHAACKELGLPIYYVIAEGANTDECVNLNIGQTNWGIRDYIDFYAALGAEEYIQLQKFVRQYDNIPLDAIIGISYLGMNGGHSSRIVKDGNFKFQGGDPTVVQNALEILSENAHVLRLLHGSGRAIFTITGWVVMHVEVDTKRLFKQIAKNIDIFPPVADRVPEYFLDRLEYVYNKGLRMENCRYFTQAYKIYRRSTMADKARMRIGNSILQKERD